MANVEYWGEVVDTTDPLKSGRVKVRVKTIFDEIDVKFIPWAVPKRVDSDTFEKPYLGEIVQIVFQNGDIMMPKWFRIRTASQNIDDEDYESFTVIKKKDLSKYGLDGNIDISYSKTNGLTFKLERENHTSEYTVRNDNTVFLKNGNTGKIIHLTKDGISIGSEDKSQQPAVVGDDNMKALQMLNDSIKEMSDKMQEQLEKLSIISGTSPYTKHLQTVFKTYKTTLKSTVDAFHSKNNNFFPETKSTFITLDKT